MIQVGLHRGNGAISRVIRWQTRSPYNHASIWIGGLGGLVYEAREFRKVAFQRGYQRRDQAEAEGETVNLFDLRCEITPEQEAKVRAFLDRQLNKDYDYTSVLRFISRRKASDTSANAWFCSELVFAALREAGIHLLERIEPWAVSPGLLALSPLLKPAV